MDSGKSSIYQAKMVLPGMTFVEHCATMQAYLLMRNVLSFLKYEQIDTVFMRNPAT